ncbi:MAG: RyR domain-containing protein [Muribaculaceae bacterium]|nr:RyR domain-containing protein [Muribaculaceae bacterium]
MKYIPSPKDTSSVTLSDDLIQLTEVMAHNVHEVWAHNRMLQGWTWGPERNEKLKQHPCLVPYEQLSEEERDYDRNTATETIKLILSQGFRIEKI